MKLEYRLKRANPDPEITVRNHKIYMNLRAYLIFEAFEFYGCNKWKLYVLAKNKFELHNDPNGDLSIHYNNGKRYFSGTNKNLADGRYSVDYGDEYVAVFNQP